MTAGRPISEDDLHGYVDGALDTARHAEVETYLERHPEIARRVLGFAAHREMLREALAPVGQEPVPPQLSLAGLIEAGRRPSYVPWRSVAAATILLVLGGAGGWFGRGMSQGTDAGVAALAREASDSFEVFGADHFRPVEFKAADRAELVGWLSERLQHPIAAPDLAASGFRFIGGRLVATPHGPAGLFMYDDDHGTRLVMLVRPMAVEKNALMSQHVNGRVAGFAWAQNGIGYSLVGAAAPERLHPLADEIRRQIANDA